MQSIPERLWLHQINIRRVSYVKEHYTSSSSNAGLIKDAVIIRSIDDNHDQVLGWDELQ